MKIADIIHEAHATACEKGWHERPLRNEAGELDVDRVAAKLALIHSEITEAWECWDADEIDIRESASGKPEGFFIELADVVIRVGDLLGALNIYGRYPGFDLLEHIQPQTDRLPDGPTAAELFMTCHATVSQALEHLRDSNLQGQESFANSLIKTMILCTRFGESELVVAVRIKMAYNRTRPHRHGGKAL